MRNYLRLALAGAISASLMGCGPEDVSNIEASDNTNAMSSQEKASYDKALDGKDGITSTGNPYEEINKAEVVDYSNNQTANLNQRNDYDAASTDNTNNIITDETKAKGMAMFGAGVDAAVAGINSIDKRQLEDIKTAALSKVGGAVKGYQEAGNGSSAPVGAVNFDSTWKTEVPSGVRVIDGDTVEIKYNDGRQSDRIRLVGIDAPESSQEYGLQSKTALQSCVDNGNVNIRYQEKDKYGRLLGIVMAGETDCNYVQVQKGAAWHYKQYSKGQPKGSAQTYAMAENDARSANMGLWAASQPQEPWLYRRANK